LLTDVFAFIDVQIRFWDPKVKVTAGNDPENCVNAISLLLSELISPKSGYVCIWAGWHTVWVYGSGQGHTRRMHDCRRYAVEFHL